MKKIALASDIDGTLVFHDEQGFSANSDTYMKEEDLAAISRWQAGGGLFGLCSGRPLAGIFRLFSGEIVPDFYIACSGAAIFDRDRKVIYEAEIDKDEARELFEEYKSPYIFDAFHTDSRDTVYRTEYSRRQEVKEILVTSPDDIGDRKLYGISLIFPDEYAAKEACRNINEKYPALEAFQNINSADIVRRGCSKGSGILRVKEYLQIDVMAGIGDSFNDIPMLREASPSFTFHRSPEGIRSQVARVVDSVAEALELMGKGECLP